ncbi:MAG: CoA pyrophosphatase [Burkholderiales bacterium]|jgi:8-oxo-dGTP pyrophosphatase MutT (NUDIX family)|nr:CoA pyrophosphatase [Burkholderiales bacterium]
MQLDPAELRRRLLGRKAPESSIYGDDGVGREGTTAAAVLIPVIAHPGELTVLFTQRTTSLRSHAGQVSFPGGRAEPEDPSVEFTALREAGEEIGLAPERVEVLGRLADYHTRTGYRVAPVIGLIEPPLELAPDPREVDHVFEVPLAFLLDPRNRQRRTREFQRRNVGFYVFEYQDRTIWGATAGILVNLYRMLE